MWDNAADVKIPQSIHRPRESLFSINNHQGDAGFIQGQCRLLTNLRKKLAVVVKHQPTGVDHLEFTVSPVTVLVGAIPRHPGLVVHDRLATSAEPVHQGGLANIGASNNCDDRTRQGA